MLARQQLLRAVAAAISLASPALPAAAISLASPTLPAAADVLSPTVSTLPLSLCGGAYCVSYTVDGQSFRAVVDTGSPFVLVDGTCDANGSGQWGCYRGRGGPSGLPDTDELFGGEDVGVQWNLGRFELANTTGLAVQKMNFGVVRSYVGKGGGGAVFLGFAKRRLPRIRPTLLEQMDVAGLRFDFLGRKMSLSRASLIPRDEDAVPILDLRPRGAPVANYAARISRLVINGQVIKLDRPAVAVIDSGTTGVSVSDSLLESGLLPAQWREARIELETEKGDTTVIEASVKRRRKPLPGVRPVDPSAEEFDEFPLIVSPVHVPWFEPGFGDSECADGQPFQCNGRPVGRRQSVLEAWQLRRDGLGEAPHVLFVGLAFLWQRTITIDIVDGRMTIV